MMKYHFTISLMAIIFSTSSIFSLRAYGHSIELRAKYDGKYYQVGILLDGEDVFSSPPEGLWSIATDWKRDPASRAVTWDFSPAVQRNPL